MRVAERPLRLVITNPSALHPALNLLAATGRIGLRVHGCVQHLVHDDGGDFNRVIKVRQNEYTVMITPASC
jgi:hypothetical protein